MHIVLLGAWCVLAATSGAPHTPHTPHAAHTAQTVDTAQSAQIAPSVSPPLMVSPANGEAPPDYFKIDGSKHPEQIPDHWIWRASFLKLATIKQAGQEADLHPVLRLSDADASVLYKEASEQLRRDSECLRVILAKREDARVQQASQATLARALADITLDCRTKDLDAADRVLDAMSLEGRDILRAWVDEARRKMTAFVPIAEKDLFRLPR